MSDDEEILAHAARRVGTLLHGKYQLDRVIGVGGMATVYAATHRNRKRFAVKMLHPEYSVRRETRARFVREGYVANSVNHPGVVTVLDDDVDETGAAFIVMELLDGVTVEALYAPTRTPVPLREALEISYQLLDVLQAAHERTIVHRDVKPANLFVLNDGQLKVLDFGIARLRDSDEGLKSTRTGTTLGTPAFMAPEQALAIPTEVDARTDIWAAGATLFTMLTARFVHDGENARQIMIRAATEPAPSIGSLAPDLPSAVVDIVTRALMFEKAARWPSALSMRDAVVEAYRDLFGEPSRSHLSALVKRAGAAIESSPTEPSPLRTSEAGAPTRVTGAGAPGEVDLSLLPASRGVAGTASTPVSTGGGRDDVRATRWRRLGLISVAGALVAAGFFLLRARRPVEERSAAPAVPALAQPPSSEARATTAVPPTPSGAPAASVASDVKVRASTPAASSRPRALVAPRPAKGDPESADSAAVAAPRPNPLQLELQ